MKAEEVRLPGMEGHGGDLLVLEMDLPQYVVGASLRRSVGSVGKRYLIESRDSANYTANEDKLWEFGLQEQRQSCLEDANNGNCIDIKVLFQVIDSHLCDRLVRIWREDAGIGDDNVKFVTALSLNAAHCFQGIGV